MPRIKAEMKHLVTLNDLFRCDKMLHCFYTK
jgi:hypothetical protein